MGYMVGFLFVVVFGAKSLVSKKASGPSINSGHLHYMILGEWGLSSTMIPQQGRTSNLHSLSLSIMTLRYKS